MAADLGALLRTAPPLLTLGVVVFGLGGLADVVYHASPVAWTPTLDGYLGADGEIAHLVLFAGMALVVLGLVATGLRTVRSYPPV